MYNVMSNAMMMVARKGPRVNAKSACASKARDVCALTILNSPLSERGTSIENHTRKDVLEARYQEEGRVLRILDIGLLMVNLWWDIPWLLLHCHVCHSLERYANSHQTKQRCENLARYEVSSWSLSAQFPCWSGPAHKDSNWEDQKQIDEQKLEVSQIGCLLIKKAH